MIIWKTAPSWFNLDNYSDSANFTSKEWAYEIDRRITSLTDILEPNTPISVLGVTSRSINDNPTKQAYKFFNHLKNYPLGNENSSNTSLDSFIALRMAPQKGRKFASIEELSEFRAYSFLLDSDRKEEIKKDYLFLHSPHKIESIDQDDHVEQKIKTFDKYSLPIVDLQSGAGKKFLEINLSASKELILEEFENWLISVKNTKETIKPVKNKLSADRNKFSSKHFQNWYSGRLLPYWDLTTIAKIENAIIHEHVLGKALFPEEFDIDLSERVRKTTKKDCKLLFSERVLAALYLQSFTNNSN